MSKCRYDRCACEGVWHIYIGSLCLGAISLALAWFAKLPLSFVAFTIPFVSPPVICGAIFCSLPHAISAARRRRDFPRARVAEKREEP